MEIESATAPLDLLEHSPSTSSSDRADVVAIAPGVGSAEGTHRVDADGSGPALVPDPGAASLVSPAWVVLLSLFSRRWARVA